MSIDFVYVQALLILNEFEESFKQFNFVADSDWNSYVIEIDFFFKIGRIQVHPFIIKFNQATWLISQLKFILVFFRSLASIWFLLTTFLFLPICFPIIYLVFFYVFRRVFLAFGYRKRSPVGVVTSDREQAFAFFGETLSTTFPAVRTDQAIVSSRLLLLLSFLTYRLTLNWSR